MRHSLIAIILFSLVFNPINAQAKGFWDFVNRHKQLDNEMISADNHGCITGYDKELAVRGVKAPIYDQACIVTNRQSKERERRDGKDGIRDALFLGLEAFELIK